MLYMRHEFAKLETFGLKPVFRALRPFSGSPILKFLLKFGLLFR